MPIKIAQQGQIQIHLKGEWCCAQIAWFSGLIFSLSLSLWSKKGAGMCKQMKIKRLAMKITSNGHLTTCPTLRSDSKKIKLSKKVA